MLASIAEIFDSHIIGLSRDLRTDRDIHRLNIGILSQMSQSRRFRDVRVESVRPSIADMRWTA
jgi:hypothetical protein